MVNDDAAWDMACQDPTVRLLKRIFYHSVECLTELSGEQFDVLIKPIVIPSAMSAAHLARGALGIEGSDLLSNARLVSFGHDYFAFGEHPPELYERAFVKRAERCLIQDGPPEACFHCRIGGVMECCTSNPDHEMIVLSSIPAGFRMCEWYIKEKARTVNAPKDYGKKIMDLAPNPLSPEQRVQIAREALAWYTSFVLMAIAEHYGKKELLDRMRYRMWYEGSKYRCQLSKQAIEVGVDTNKAISTALDAFGIKVETNANDGYTDFTTKSCPFSGLDSSYCAVLEMFLEGLCKGDENDKEFVQLERMTEGATACHYVCRSVSHDRMKWTDKDL